MKYRSKEIVDAYRYITGLEDGFSCIPYVGMCKWMDEKGAYKQCNKCTLKIPKKPFIIDDTGDWLYLDGSQYIVTYCDGGINTMGVDEFNKKYEPIKKENK